MKKQLIILFLAIMTVCFSFNTVLGIDLYPAVDGHYYVFEDLLLPSASIGSGIELYYDTTTSWCPGMFCSPVDERRFGIIEFDISGLNALFSMDDPITATLTLTTKYDTNNSFSLYDTQDTSENGVLEFDDVLSPGPRIEVFNKYLDKDDTVTFNVTDAIRHDLFDTGQTDYSGFFLSIYGRGGILFYDHTDSLHAPLLRIYIADVDNDGIGDVSDPDTIYGTVSGDVQEGINVNIYIVDCGSLQPHATVITDANGYYAIGDLGNARYLVAPEDASYSFSTSYWVDILQAEIQPYNFTATSTTP